MTKIYSEFKRYNANPNDKDVGDCVKRSISLALGLDYDKVSKELNKIRKELNLDQYNYPAVYERYLRSLGYTFQKYEPVTESEFSDTHPEGIYILEVGPERLVTKGGSNHLVCIMNGNIYDSWDSSDDIITKVCVVSHESSEFEDTNTDEMQVSVYAYLQEYVQKFASKLKFDTVDIQEKPSDSEYTIGYYVFVKIPKDVEPYSQGRYYYRPGTTYGHTIYGKINPRASQEDNYHKLCSKMKQKIYDWLYNENKVLKDSIESRNIDVNPAFHGSRQDLMKVPEWARPLVLSIDINDNSSWGGGYKYEVYMEPLPGDPRGDDPKLNDVGFYADTLTELKYEFEQYKKNYARYGYEY